MKTRTKLEQFKLAKKIAELHDGEDKVPFTYIATRLAISESYTCKLYKQLKSNWFSDADFEDKVLDVIGVKEDKNAPKEPEKELVRGYVVNKDSKTNWIPSLYFEVEITAGLTGTVRDLELQKAILSKLDIQEI